MSDILKDKNGKTLVGAALQKRLAKLAKENNIQQPVLKLEMIDLEQLNYEEIAAEKLDWIEPTPQASDIETLTVKVLEVGKNSEKTLTRNKEFTKKINARLEFKERQGQIDYRTRIANQTEFTEAIENNNDSTIPLKDLTKLINNVGDLTSLVVDQDLRIAKLEPEINKNKVFGLAAKNLADILLVGSVGGTIIGLCIMIVHPNYPSQTKLGTMFGFVCSASISLLGKLNAKQQNN